MPYRASSALAWFRLTCLAASRSLFTRSLACANWVFKARTRCWAAVVGLGGFWTFMVTSRINMAVFKAPAAAQRSLGTAQRAVSGR